MKKRFVVAACATAVVTGCAQYSKDRPAPRDKSGRVVFLQNCAHCHGADARGAEGPDLHGLEWTDPQIADRIRSGKKGQMTAFSGKLREEEIQSVISYLHTLK